MAGRKESDTHVGDEKPISLAARALIAFNFIASIITVINFLFAIKTIAIANTPKVDIDFSIDNNLLALLVFMVLEACLNYAFAIFVVQIARMGEGLPFISVILTCSLSAVLSILNAQWVIVGGIPETSGEWASMVLASAAACLLAIYCIQSKFNKVVSAMDDTVGKKYVKDIDPLIKRAHVVQAFCFVGFFIVYAAS